MSSEQSSLASKFSKIAQIEKKKIEQKGIFNVILGYLLLVGSIWTGRQIGVKFWPESIQNKPLFYLVGAVSIHLLTQFVIFLLYLPGYLNLMPFFQKYKINTRSTWPWQRKNWKITLEKTVYNLLINQLFVYPLIVTSSSLIGMRQRFTDFPSFQELFSQVLIVYFIEDFFFYWGHRFFHMFPALYKMHKIHHEYDKVYTFATEFFHPFDFAIANIMPSALGFIFLGSRAHCFTFFFWIAWKVMISSEGHSGYEFPWSPMRVLPLVSGPSYHDHHHSNNVGNFAGSCYFWDLMLGTSDPYWKEYLKEKK